MDAEMKFKDCLKEIVNGNVPENFGKILIDLSSELSSAGFPEKYRQVILAAMKQIDYIEKSKELELLEKGVDDRVDLIRGYLK